MTPFPDSVEKLIEGKSFAKVATFMKDGSPHRKLRGGIIFSRKVPSDVSVSVTLGGL